MNEWVLKQQAIGLGYDLADSFQVGIVIEPGNLDAWIWCQFDIELLFCRIVQHASVIGFSIRATFLQKVG